MPLLVLPTFALSSLNINMRCCSCLLHAPQAVASTLNSSRAPSQQELSKAKASLEQLQHDVGHAALSWEEASYLMLFIFRPFLAHILTTVSSSTASCALALLQLLQHVVQLLSAAPGQ
jgi:hypothetical protein